VWYPGERVRTIDPAKARSVVRVRVRFGETDQMGVVHHANYAAYMEVARIEWLRRRGVTYATWATHGIHLPVVELAIKYRAPARFDDELDVEAKLTEAGAASVRFDYRIVRTTDAVLCAQGSTRLACVDDRGALRRITDEMVQSLLQADEA
jgi:acyl-CoA thioester hydrolase